VNALAVAEPVMEGAATRDPFTVRVENPPVPVDNVAPPLKGVEDPINLSVMDDRPLYPLAGRVIVLVVFPPEVEVKFPRELA
jgi:hypothetical protein